MAERQLTLPGTLVKKSNAVARARWSAKSVYEPRLVALVATQVRSTDADFQMYEIPVSHIMQGNDGGGKTYEIIEQASENLMKKVITIPTKSGWVKYNVFSKCEYDSKKGCIKARFDPDMKDHYLNLRRDFTQYNIIEYLRLPSIYSQRIFEFLKSWSSESETTIDLKDLFEMLDVPESFKKDFRNFRLRVLEKAHKDIHKLTLLKYEWEPIKKGRSVVAIRFIFSDGKESIVAKGKKAISDQKTSQENNKYFTAAVKCHQSGECNCKPTSKKCALCKKLFPIS